MSQINDYDLVQLVETFPILYDKTLARGQKNAVLKDKAWTAVSLKLNASERACITRWKSIRDRFGKEYRRAQEHPHEPVCSWDLFQHLLFLKDHYKQGHASQDAIEVRYEPKQRRRKYTRRNTERQDEEESHDEEDTEELLINQQLIALVKEHPVLYDKYKIRDSKNLTAKNDAWTEISMTMGISEEVCYLRWKKLRDRFARTYRNQQLEPDKPVQWIYFPQLLFLAGHYRKGIPLNVEEVKNKARAKQMAKIETEDIIAEEVEMGSPWGTDYPSDYNTITEGVEVEQDNVEYSDLQTLEELLIIPAVSKPSTPFRTNRDEILTTVAANNSMVNINMASSVPPMPTSVRNATEPEQHLTHVINNIETVLRQSQDCLKALQQQKQRHIDELTRSSNCLTASPTMVQKINILLDGLNGEERIKAERKILQFLCECQIRTLNNQEVEDVLSSF